MEDSRGRDVDSFVAIDFETATYAPDSACAVGAVRADAVRIRERFHALLRPPELRFHFTHVHGISAATVVRSPTWVEVWPELEAFLRGAAFVAAHNAAFDRRVLTACCRAAGLRVPRLHWVCTVEVAREMWGIYPTTLTDVCRVLGIPLGRHHDALDDATACAHIVRAALREGWDPWML